ncbi:MAG: amidohydrolase family protein [Pseudomonadota bacterium]
MITLIEAADWAVAWDQAEDRHVYRRSVDIAFEADKILHVGPGYTGPRDDVIDGRGLMIMPGLVNIHSHPLSEPMNQGFLDEAGSQGLYQSSLYEYMPIHRPDLEGMRACAEKGIAELLLSGVTTLVDLSVPYDGWEEIVERSGIRGVLAPMFRSAAWFTRNGHVVEYDWSGDDGQEAMGAALALIDNIGSHPRLTGMVAPSQIDTCSPDLIRAAYAAAAERGLPFQIHAAQSVVEFHEITRRHGVTPVQWLDSLDVLGPTTILGHGIFLDEHPWVHWPGSSDLARLAETGTAVAHCPTVFQRRGITLRTLGRYLRDGVRVGLGTDTYPHNMLEEMRTAAYLSRVTSGFASDVTTRAVFEAVTRTGSALLGRDDIGRLAPGARADLVAVDLERPQMKPLRDPLKSLIYVAAERAVRDVWVAGQQVVSGGHCLTLDLETAAERVSAAQARAQSKIPQLHHANLTGWDIAPPVVDFAPGEGP